MMKIRDVHSLALFGHFAIACGLLLFAMAAHADDIYARPDAPNEFTIKNEIQAKYTAMADVLSPNRKTEGEKPSSQEGTTSYVFAIKSIKWNGEHLADVESVLHDTTRYLDTEGNFGVKGQYHKLDMIIPSHDTWRWQSRWEGFKWVSTWEQVKTEWGTTQLLVDGKIYQKPAARTPRHRPAASSSGLQKADADRTEIWIGQLDDALRSVKSVAAASIHGQSSIH